MLHGLLVIITWLYARNKPRPEEDQEEDYD
jgi:hypothetical protein